MKPISIFLALLFAVSLVDMNALGVFFIDEPLERGEFETAYFNIRNDLNRELEEVNVKLYIYDLGLMFTSMGGDIQERDHVVQRVFMPIPSNVAPGDYTAKVVVGNDEFRDSKHILLRVV